MHKQPAAKATPVSDPKSAASRRRSPESSRGSAATVDRLGNAGVLRRLANDSRHQVSEPGDRHELEAARVAQAVTSERRSPIPVIVERSAAAPAACACGGTCDACRERRASSLVDTVRSSPGARLDDNLRTTMEARFGRLFGHVQVHDDPVAADSARALDARAYTVGSHVVFGAGEYAPQTATGMHLLAHELTHVVQQEGTDQDVVQRQEATISSSSTSSKEPLVCSAEPKEPLVCSAEPKEPLVSSVQPKEPLVSSAEPKEALVCSQPQEKLVCEATSTGEDVAPLDQRIAAFKQSVTSVAIQRMMANIHSLDEWAVVVQERLSDELIGVLGLAQGGGYGAYREAQSTHNPLTREIKSAQALGRYRACTGCHLLVYASQWGAEQPHFGPEWLSPNERRQGGGAPGMLSTTAGLSASDEAQLTAWVNGASTAPRLSTTNAPSVLSARPTPTASSSGGYTPPPGTAEAALMTAFPDPARVEKLMRQALAVLGALGDGGYHVLPGGILDNFRRGDVQTVKRNTLDAIAGRQADYDELARMIQAGQVTWEKFGPVIQTLLPVADADVRDAIQKEMDDNAFWETVNAIVLGVMSIAALLLAIFPPTSPAGVALLASLEVTLATYGLVTGPEMITTGHAYALSEGTTNVFSAEQQQAAGMMMLSGFLGIVTAPLGIAGGISRATSGVARTGVALQQTSRLLSAGQTIERGEWVISMTEDGALIATSTRQPDALIIVRGQTATLYQSMGPGGLRVIASTTVPEAAEAAAAEGRSLTPLLGAGQAGTLGMDFTATTNRLEQIIRTGGRLPEETRAVGAAIIEVPGYKGPTELRAISGAGTDVLGQGAPVAHAGTPQTRTLSAARTMSGAAAHGEFPFSHVNDAEIKLFEEIRRNLPPNATGRIHVLSMRSSLRGTVIEPLPMCSSCTMATHQIIGDFPGVEIVVHSEPFPPMTSDVGVTEFTH